MRLRANTVGLVLHYKLWTPPFTSGKVFDYSLNGYTGTVNGTSLKPVYPGYDFAGADEYIDIGSTLAALFAAPFTVSQWLKFDNTIPAAQENLLGLFDGVSNAIRIIRNSTGELRCYYLVGANSADAVSNAGNLITGGKWYHFIVTIDATSIKLYLDSSLVTLGALYQGDMSGVTMGNYNAVINPYIGARNNSSSADTFFPGLINDLMIFNVAKSAVEIRNIYESTRWRHSK